MNRLTLTLLMILAFVEVYPAGMRASGAATIYYVDRAACPGPGSGILADPYCKIQDAIAGASAGDTIKVAQGTYTEPTSTPAGCATANAVMFCVDKSLTLTGDLDAAYGSGPHAPVIDGAGAEASGFAIAAGVSNVIIQGFEVTNFTNPGALLCSLTIGGIGSAINSWNTGATNITIRSNSLHDLGWNGVLVGSDNGSLQSGWRVERNVVANALYAGIELTNVMSSIVRRNKITPRTGTCVIDPGDSGVGIEIAIRDHGTGVTGGDVTVEYNDMTGVQFDRAGINILARAYVDGANAVLSGVTVTRNDVLVGGQATGILVTGESRTATNNSATVENVSIASNIVKDHADGIVIRDCGNFDCSVPDPVGTVTISVNEIKKNIVTFGSGLGIHLGTGADATSVVSNQSKNNLGNGFLVDSNGNTLVKNLAPNNGGDGIHLALGTTGNLLTKNQAKHNTGNGIEDAGSNTCPTTGSNRNIATTNGAANFVGCP